jgi:ferredoxin
VRSRLLVFGPWVVAGHMFAWPIVEHWFWPEEKRLPAIADWELQLQTDRPVATFPGPIMSVATFVIAGGLIVWWLGAKGFCTHGCPYGAFFAVADRFAPVRIKVTDACNGCGHCTQVCTSNVRVHEEVAKHGKHRRPGLHEVPRLRVGVPEGRALRRPRGAEAVRDQPAAHHRRAPTSRGRRRCCWRWSRSAPRSSSGAAPGSAKACRSCSRSALGVITAVFTLLAAGACCGGREVTFQHTALKQRGRLTRAGRFGRLLLLGAWLLFTGCTRRLHGERTCGDSVDAREPVTEPLFYVAAGERTAAGADPKARWARSTPRRARAVPRC